MNKKEIIKKLEKNREKIKEKIYYKKFLIIILLLAMLFIFSTLIIVPITSSQGISYCCEKTKQGAFCQNSNPENCDPDYLSTPTSCEATSFCQRGTCYDSDEGICSLNVPERSCKENNGLWTEDENPPQCASGCCILGQQASFTTLQRCKKISGQYGLQVDFRNDVADEISCIAIATSQDVGACVFESEFINTCKFTTRGECNSQALPGVTNGSSVRFVQDRLCTDPSLNTNCEKTKKTTCIEGKDEVYFIDTCNNPSNIYDARKADDIEYWTRVFDREESCGAGTGSVNSKTCGNCDYLGGSICAKSEHGLSATYGEYICNDINCYGTSNGKDYKNGESWCVFDKNNPNIDLPGSRYFRHVCFMGEETIEPCADYRQESCIQSSIGEKEDFSQAGCVINRWQDCILVDNIKDCLNSDKRDCSWIPIDEESLAKGQGVAGELQNVVSSIKNIEKASDLIFNFEETLKEVPGKCVPKIAPGLQHWDASSESTCSVADRSCLVRYTKKLYQDEWECKDNCFCLEEKTKLLFNYYCTSIGDCGAGFNYIGKLTLGGLDVSTGDVDKEDIDHLEQGGSSEPGGAQTFPSGTTTVVEETKVSSQPAQPGGNNVGNVVQGFIVKTYNKLNKRE